MLSTSGKKAVPKFRVQIPPVTISLGCNRGKEKYLLLQMRADELVFKIIFPE